MSTYALVGAAVALVGAVAYKLLAGGKPRLQRPGVVYLRQYERGLKVPQYSPFCMKLETYLRLAGIEYRHVGGMALSKKGKCPWIQLDGVAVEDSELCIKFLNEKKGVDLNRHLSRQDKATLHAAARMLEESTYWGMVHFRWMLNLKKTVTEVIGLDGLAGFVVGKVAYSGVKKSLHGHGLGRHTPEVVQAKTDADLRALEAILGDKDYFGGTQPCEFDAHAFALVANYVWGGFDDDPAAVLIKNELPGLMDFAQRMRERVYPDWDELLRDGGKKAKRA